MLFLFLTGWFFKLGLQTFRDTNIIFNTPYDLWSNIYYSLAIFVTLVLHLFKNEKDPLKIFEFNKLMDTLRKLNRII